MAWVQLNMLMETNGQASGKMARNKMVKVKLITLMAQRM